MGKSYTYHVVGETDQQHVIGAMSRLEMVQEEAIALRHGEKIVLWYAQTGVGLRMLGTDVLHLPKIARLAPKARVITCTVCQGFGCPVCRNSGITQRGESSRYQPWQLARMAAEVEQRKACNV